MTALGMCVLVGAFLIMFGVAVWLFIARVEQHKDYMRRMDKQHELRRMQMELLFRTRP